MPKLPVRFARRGFTLIELLIVIVIIGILAGVVLVVLNPAKQQRKSSESVLAANANKVCLALYSCAQTSTDVASCGTLDLIGAEDPSETPATSTYALSTVGTTVTSTATLPASGGSLGVDDCVYTCSYDFATGTPVNLAGTGCY